jgi:hypothetical protein
MYIGEQRYTGSVYTIGALYLAEGVGLPWGFNDGDRFYDLSRALKLAISLSTA